MAGAEDDADAWVAEHGDALFRFALARLGNAAAAEEAVQEALVAAWRQRDSFRGGSALRTWLTGILRHKVIDQLRRRCRELPFDADDATMERLFHADGHHRSPPSDWDLDPSNGLERSEFWSGFAACRDALPPRQAALFTLRVLDDVPVDQLCKDFDLTPTNLGVILHRARTRLRACLESRWSAEERR